ncbi:MULTISPECIES: type IV pilus assembly protein PilM [Neptunomonas]|uniref:Type IV pilus assembly protein PilM n=1 Tax=Neptunomonas qingdaonensis TaxID=1045558 RepID=A0A1I2MBC1_9GAMM|nr:type IV pilus assembly protein PilM [Neptunomonas qingdaonensis]SFF86511.1 type IV pilus assembly protein PilM [Neptunomonas qingdaonensis]
MVSFFGKKTASWVGVDIGSSSVKLVVLSRHGSLIGLDAYAVVSLPPTAVVDGNLQEVQAVTEAIGRAIKICGIKQGNAIAAVPSSAVIIKRMELSSAFSEVELEDQVKVEADQFIPYPLDEVALDFEILGESRSRPELNDLLLVACRRDDVDQREDAINAAGLKCEVVDVDTYAIERVFPMLLNDNLKSDEMVAIIDVGAATLTLNVMRDHKIIYNREQSFGGNDLTTNIHHQYGMAIDEVEQALRLGEISEEVQETVIQPFRLTVSQQVSRALQFFYSSGVQHQLTKIYLCGGVASIDGLVDIIGEELGIPVSIANPFEQMDIGVKVNKERLVKDTPALVKACGLALRSFDQ